MKGAETKGERKRKSAFYAFAQKLGFIIFKPLYRYRVIGRENIPKSGKVLVCSNHISELDPIFLGLSMKRQIFFMAKEELFKHKIIAVILKGLGGFPVARGTGGEQALQRAYSLMDENALVGVFVEGTRSKTGYLLKPKTGAALIAYRTQPTILPVSVVASTGGAPKMFGTVTIRIGKPLEYEQVAIADAASVNLRRASRKIMEEITELWKESRKQYSLPEQPEISDT